MHHSVREWVGQNQKKGRNLNCVRPREDGVTHSVWWPGFRLGDRNVSISSKRKRVLSALKGPHRFCVSPSLLPSGYCGPFLSGIQGSARKTNHSTASSAEDKNEWSNTSIPLHTFIACKRTASPLVSHMFLCACEHTRVGILILATPR